MVQTIQKLLRGFILVALFSSTSCGIKFKKVEKAQESPQDTSATDDHEETEFADAGLPASDQTIKSLSERPRGPAEGVEYDYSQRGELWEYDSGPDVSTVAGKAFAQIIAETPNYRALGAEAFNTSKDKFKWKMGPMFYRGRTGANQVKVLVIGQEGAQDENSSFRSFTGGTGGRMQHYLRQMGIDESYLFINTFSYTINGQYGEREPVLKNGKFQWMSILSPEMLKLSQDPLSPIVKNRNKLIDHVVRNNPETLKLVIAVGGAAKETLASYVMARGGTCENMYRDMRGFNRVKTASESAGGNRRFYFPVGSDRKNILLKADEMDARGRALRFTWGKYAGERIEFDNQEHQAELQMRLSLSGLDREQALTETQKQEYRDFNTVALSKIVKIETGIENSGFEDPRQLGVNFDSCQLAGDKKNLKGAEIPPYANTPGHEEAYRVAQTLRYITVQHPGSKSAGLQSNFKGRLKEVQDWLESDPSWSLPPDIRNGVALSQPLTNEYQYTHLPVPRRDFRFGLPELIGLGNTSTTRKSNGSDSNSGLVIGGRESGARFDEIVDVAFEDDAYKVEPSWEPSKKDFTEFDFGPGSEWTKVLTGVEGVKFPIEEVAKANTTMEALYGFGAIYRGRPEKAKLLILADEKGYDDIWVGRALVGEAGQRLQSLIEALGVGRDYIILRTMPVSTADGTDELKRSVYDLTSEWRKSVISKVIAKNEANLKAVIAIGSYASESLDSEVSLPPGVTKVKLSSYESEDLERSYGSLSEVFGVNQSYRAKLRPIPRYDIPYGLPRWVGTAGDRVANAQQYNKKGKYFMVAAPTWSTKRRAPELSQEEKAAMRDLGLLEE